MNKTLYLNSSFEAKSYKKGSKSLKIAGYANTTCKDRAGDVVTAQAWAKGVDNFRKNPVLLYQHKHDTPIGRIEKIRVDKKGIFVEGAISEAAEKTHGIQTLIKDGALKSFSVGFRVKDGKYNREDDSTTITEVELLEISVVSIPCNQESLFSIRKSFESDEEYKSFVDTMDEQPEEDKEKIMRTISAGITNVTDGHYHTIEVDADNNGVTTYASHMGNHAHKIIDGVMQPAGDPLHTHDITVLAVPILNAESEEVITERPMSPTEEQIMSELTVETDEIEEKLVDSASITEADDTEIKEDEEELEIRDPNEAIPMVNLLSVDSENLQHNDLVNYNSKMYKVTKLATAQSPIFKFLEIDANGKDCDNVLNVNADELSSQDTTQKEISETEISETDKQISEDKDSNESLTKELHTNSDKENEPMADQVVDTIDLKTVAEQVAVETKAAPAATVSEPQVAKLVEKTGEAIMQESDAQEKAQFTPRASEELAELKAQMSKYQEEITALQNTKMQFQENSRTQSQFSEADMAKAVILAKAMGKHDVFDTKYGSRMKAVTTVDQFLSNFSSNIYTEMEQQLVIAPMFERMAVDARNFRVPVADEDTDGDVAMFQSGTFATGIADAANVPASNQNTIKSVEFTPHKFMASTHLAKDEEEDTVLPLIDFLRAAATRRLARSIDKSLLRGTGALGGFTQKPASAITVGVGMPSVIQGVVSRVNAIAGLKTAIGGPANDVTPARVAVARGQLGKYGLQLGNDLVLIVGIQQYNALVSFADFRTVDQFGPNATYLTGSVGAIYGIPVVVSEFMDVNGVVGNNIGLLMYKPGFMIAERRGMEIESEYEPRQQVTAMYMSTRMDFQPLTTNAGNALDATKYSYGALINI
jgi:HK97 family phage prohead protease/HK97 family phage major capsid protein